ncbi:MAG: hypothetical protein HQ553_16830 [Chloroflexi bacterium]|nr:hypothetical protein [Chloroflexota bacterium]
MSEEGNHIVIPQTVLQVIERFVAAMREDSEIPNDAINQFEILLRKGTVPKPDDIKTALFESQTEGEA